MNRRQVLVAGGLAAVSALASAKGELGPVAIGGGAVVPAGGAVAVPCALLPIEYTQRATGAPIGQLQIAKYWANQTTSTLALWNFDLQVYDNQSLPQWVYAWQLRRSASGMSMPSNGVRMRFPTGAQLDMTATVRARTGTAQVFSAKVPNGALMVLATARTTTGRPPEMMDLRYDPARTSLYMTDGSPRDFDALLLRTT